MTLYRHSGVLLRSDGKLAAGPDCCCGPEWCVFDWANPIPSYVIAFSGVELAHGCLDCTPGGSFSCENLAMDAAVTVAHVTGTDWYFGQGQAAGTVRIYRQAGGGCQGVPDVTVQLTGMDVQYLAESCGLYVFISGPGDDGMNYSFDAYLSPNGSPQVNGYTAWACDGWSTAILGRHGTATLDHAP